MLRDVTLLESRSTGFAYAVRRQCCAVATTRPYPQRAPVGRGLSVQFRLQAVSPPSTVQAHDFLVSDAPRQPHADLPGRRQGHRLLRVRTNHRGVVEHHPHLLGDCGNIGINIDTSSGAGLRCHARIPAGALRRDPRPRRRLRVTGTRLTETRFVPNRIRGSGG